MSEPRVIRADYANWRTVAGRKVLQLVFEVPIEQTADVMEKLGVPMPGESKWCAIALLENGACAGGSSDGKHGNAPKPSAASEQPTDQNGLTLTHISAHTARAGTSQKAGEERRPFSSLPLSQQAAIRCSDPAFIKYMSAKTPEEAASEVRNYCGVSSRAQLLKGTPEGNSWSYLENAYQDYLTTQRYREARHG